MVRCARCLACLSPASSTAGGMWCLLFATTHCRPPSAGVCCSPADGLWCLLFSTALLLYRKRPAAPSESSASTPGLPGVVFTPGGRTGRYTSPLMQTPHTCSFSCMPPSAHSCTPSNPWPTRSWCPWSCPCSKQDVRRVVLGGNTDLGLGRFASCCSFSSASSGTA